MFKPNIVVFQTTMGVINRRMMVLQTFISLFNSMVVIHTFDVFHVSMSTWLTSDGCFGYDYHIMHMNVKKYKKCKYLPYC